MLILISLLDPFLPDADAIEPQPPIVGLDTLSMVLEQATMHPRISMS